MPLDLDDTIAGPASPPGASERGIIRISGPAVSHVIRLLFRENSAGAEDVDHPESQWAQSVRSARYEGSLICPTFPVPIPSAMMYWPTRRSFTGQPMAEFHLVGAPPLMDSVLEGIFQSGARPARRGEFTMRAFLNGRIDLLQAEAVLGVIDATDHEELQQALSQLGGGLTRRIGSVRHQLIALLGDLEAGLDFVDEDIEFITRDQIIHRLTECLGELTPLIDDSETRLPSGWRRRIVLAGLPNAGKSTLFNTIVGDNRAIVSPIAGTTRDYLTAVIRLGNQEVELIDTAGTEDARDLVMQRAQHLRSEQISASDLILWCRSAGESPSQSADGQRLLSEIEQVGLSVICVITQSDRQPESTADANSTPSALLAISAVTGFGMQLLMQQITSRLLQDTSQRGELLGASAARCRDSLRRAVTAIESAREAAAEQSGDELIALELREALRELASIMGEVYTDDILDHIFSSFCIGK
ncbi:MAG: tRNA modification GTPase [Planctomyces sp.]